MRASSKSLVGYPHVFVDKRLQINYFKLFLRQHDLLKGIDQTLNEKRSDYV